LAIVIDANLVVVLASRDPRAGTVERSFAVWLEAGEDLFAPTLFPYEVANGLTRLSVGGLLPVAELDAAWRLAQQLPIQLLPMSSGLNIIQVARRLQRSSVYDAAYVELAQQLGADLWTLDGSLARHATALGLPVRLVESLH
jgi:predicted nucleic acid-binding protein